MRPLARPLAAAPAAALATLLAVAAALPAAATSYVPVADPDLLAAAQAVVEARVLSVAPAPDDGGWPATDYMIEVEKLIAGEVSGRNLIVRLPGGTRPDGSGMRVFGVPRFGVGEELLLFLGAGDDGTYHVTHLMLGAFRERVVAGRRVLLRELDGATEVSLPGRTLDPRTFDPRDAAGFTRWLADAARGIEREADYFLADEEVRGIERVSGEFNFFSDDRTGSNLRWFRFDEGKNVVFRIAPGGQPGFGEEATGAAVQRAVAALNGAPGTRIAYAYGGVDSGGFNMIQFENAGDEIDEDFSCSDGGVLAVGGPAYSPLRQVAPDGKLYHPITNGAVTLNDGIECFLQRLPNSLDQLLAHELGHTLGLHHSCGDGLNSCDNASSALRDALMFPNIHNDARGARLGDDDRAALRALYPGPNGGGGGGAPVAAPSDLAATAISSSEVELTWSDNSDDETQFRVEARPAGGSFARVATTGANATGVTVGGLSPATAYDFRVQARRAGTASPFSPAASATTLPDAPAAPGSLAAAALSADGVTLTWSDQSGDEIGFAIEARTPSTEGWNEIAAVPPNTTELTLDLPTGVPHSFRVRALGTEQPSEPSEVVSVTPEAPNAPCGGDPAVLCLGQRFRVTVDWRNPHGVGFGTGTAAAFDGDQSGTFWFFDPANVELIVKVLDGTALNDHFWIFHGALSDVEYWISVRDTATGRSRTYYNPPFDQCGQLDTAGIPGGEELPAAVGSALVFPNKTPAASAAATDCGDEETLCLLGGRFEVEVDWVNQHQPGDAGVGHRVPGTDQTGYFWFFDPSNVELVVKALDARTVNGRFWIFFGSLSDVEYTITVTDTETLQQRTYVNNPGSTCGQFDTAAFPIDTAGLVAPAP